MDRETETIIDRLMSDLKAAQDLSEYLATNNKKLRDEIFNLKTEVHFDDQTIKSLQVISERLQKKNEQLQEALSDLVAVQNGPPLIQYEREWNEAMSKALAALKEDK